MKKVSITKIINTVAQFYKVSPKKLQQKSRKVKFMKPRHIAMYLLREELKRSFPSIGRLFGSRDHTTAIHAYNKIIKMIQTSSELKSEIEQIKNMLYSKLTHKDQPKKDILNQKETKTKDIDKQNKFNKRERFKRLAVYRTNEVLKRLKILGNCANRSAYDYTEEEINKIFSEIKRKFEAVKAKFHFPKKEDFKL